MGEKISVERVHLMAQHNLPKINDDTQSYGNHRRVDEIRAHERSGVRIEFDTDARLFTVYKRGRPVLDVTEAGVPFERALPPEPKVCSALNPNGFTCILQDGHEGDHSTGESEPPSADATPTAPLATTPETAKPKAEIPDGKHRRRSE